LIEGRAILLPRAYGFVHDGKPVLLARVDRLTLVEVNGHKVLMREDAIRAFRESKKLYDYGILVKVSEDPDATADLRRVQHPSIKLLYSDPSKPWHDPWTSGANER
jgi:hypothetical protein